MMVEVGVFEAKTLSGGDVTNQYIDMGYTIVGKPVIMIDRVMLAPDVDFSVSGTRISFLGAVASGGAEELVEGDTLNIWYNKSVHGF